MNTQDVAKLTGISVRTLHHYDDIGLLCPKRNPLNGYRIYSEQDLDILQQILLFKACGFTLTKIKKILCDPAFDEQYALELQKKTLLYEKERIDLMLNTLEKTIATKKGEYTMKNSEKFAGLDLSNNPYEEEARQLWGDDAIDQSKSHIEKLNKQEKKKVTQNLDQLFATLSNIRHEDPVSPLVLKAIDQMYQQFNQDFGYHYTLEAFDGVGQLYIMDERFKENIDQYGDGLAEFLAQAIHHYVISQSK